MAGLGQQTLAQHVPPAPSNRPLPTGPCSHHDGASGACGCEQFWDKCSAEIHQGSKEQRSNSERSTYCVCGHHACFHKAAIPVAQPRVPVRCDGQCHLHSGPQCDSYKSTASRRNELPPPAASQSQYSGRFKMSHASASQQAIGNESAQVNGSGLDDGGRDSLSEPSTSGLPRVPSMCLLSKDRHPAVNRLARDGASQSRGTITGLGLSMLDVGGSTVRQPSVASTVPDDIDIDRVLNASHSELEMPSTRANSIAGEQRQVTSAAPRAFEAIVEYHQNLRLDVSGDTIPYTFNPDEFIQSATEVATPSNANTPNLAGADQAVLDGKKFIDGLMQLTSNVETRNSSESRPVGTTSALAPQLLLTNSPDVPQEQLHNVIKSASPQTLHKLVSYLAPLHNLLNSIPNVANTMRELQDRLALLENNNSFNYVHPEELQHHFDACDGRLTHLEVRMDEHDRLHQAIDADLSSQSATRRRVATITDSFGSNHSFQSATSSALVLAAVDRKNVATEIGGLKDRLDVLEAAALPTSLSPWELEIVLLPWGQDLRGIWYSPDEPMHDPTNATTQDPEEWTQARSSTLGHSRTSLGPRDTDSSPQGSVGQSSRSSHPFSDTESGWSSQAISDWASGSSDELLSPKACGSNNLVYKRLKSRGFIKTVAFTGASAKDIQTTLSRAFHTFTERLKYSEEEGNPTTDSYPGLRASFVPLRKVIKESRLRFLTPAEMASSALWSAQFLASGVLMRVSGGKKRLYVTHREGYIQPSDDTGLSWTWQDMRVLPRYTRDPDAQMDGNDEQCQPQVAEADAKEANWSFYEAYDALPPSANTSFGSHHSVQLSMRPADRDWRRSMTPIPILKNGMGQPISPSSEFHPRRPAHVRTVSASIIEPATSGSSKRRLNSSPVKQSSAPQTAPRTPSVTMARLKRRRTNGSSSPRPDALEHEAPVAVFVNTPRRSREPPSPFISSVPPFPRSSSDLASRQSQRSVAVVGKSTPFAYATPHSGAFIGVPGFAGGGDTEADEHVYQDDDGEQSWRGLATGDDDSASSSSSSDDDDDDTGAGAEEPASFSGDDALFDSDDDEGERVHGDTSSEEDEDGFRSSRPGDNNDDDDDDDDDEEEGDDDVFDTLLGILQS